MPNQTQTSISPLTKNKNFSLIHTSQYPKSLGGPVFLPIEKYVFYFDEEESFFENEKFAAFYIVNNINKNTSISEVNISAFFDTSEHVDKFNQIFLANMYIEVIDAVIFEKNKIHLTYNEKGFVLDLNQNITELKRTQEIRNQIIIEEPLDYLDFYPFMIKVSITNPIERVKELPIILNVKYKVR